MRVGIVSEWFSRGAGYVARQYREVLEAQGNEVFIYSRGDEHLASGPEWRDEQVYRGVPCRIGKPKAIYAPDFQSWLKHLSPDIVIFNEQHWLPPVLWTRAMGIPTAAYVDYYTQSSLASFEWYDALLCNTRRHASACGWHLGSHYLPWGTDLSRFAPAPRPNRPVTFLHSAGWDPDRKGTEQAIRCWLKLGGESRLIVHSQADISAMVQSLAASQIIESGALTVLGGTIDPTSLYGLGDVYVYPTHLEGIGLTIVEALASGLPVIVPDDGPMNEFCLDGVSITIPIAERYRRKDGYFWPCNNIDDGGLIKAMEAFVHTTGEQVESWRSKCRQAAVANFDWSRNASGLSAILSTGHRHSVDRKIARASGRVWPNVAKVESLGGRVAAGIFGGRNV